ncbi:hypothetical protein WJX84_010320 [Apatococcus fuscideae]|uniref:Uncharacterized protein n=1 Tax=Apatococcus fuscideae TaxID=2026836 RepID=A0AAW1SRW5_9CHLO
MADLSAIVPGCSLPDAAAHSRFRDLTAQPRVVLKHLHTRISKAIDHARHNRVKCQAATLDSGSGGREPPSQPPALTSERGPEGEDEPVTPEALLKEAGLDAGQLPKDMQEALRNGQLAAKDLEAWLRISGTPVLNWICRVSAGFRNRMLGNPQFVMVLIIEQAIGISAKLAAEVDSRKDRFWKEIPMVASDLALEIFGDFIVVWILSPKKTFAQVPKQGLSRAIDGLPGHVLQVGSYSPAQRVGCLFYKAVLFFISAFGASVLGHSLAKFAVAQQQKSHPAEAGGKQLAPVWDNSLGWGSFVAVSTNLRYQTVGAIEERVFERFISNPQLKSLVIFLTRFGNTFVGGAQWIQYAKAIGLQ